MPKQAKSTKKVGQICQEYPNEFAATPAGDMRCNLCEVSVKCDKKFFCGTPRKNKQRQGKLGHEKANPKASKSFYNSIK